MQKTPPGPRPALGWLAIAFCFLARADRLPAATIAIDTNVPHQTILGYGCTA